MIHYDPHKWLDHFFDYRGSLLKEISGRVLVCVAWSAAVVAFHKHVTPVGMAPLLHTLVGLALGLLLVFRTNASYDRYWEGRRLWGGIVNSSRNLIRGATVYLRTETELLRRLACWTAVFPWAAMNSLRGEPGLGPYGADLPRGQATEASNAQHPALAVSVRMAECLDEARRRQAISDVIQAALDQNVQALVDHLGGCERIRRTPLPFAYVVHLRRALVIYCFTLPFALVETFGWATMGNVLVIAYTFFGIEEIGVEIEGPFGHDENDLPLEDICETIHRNIYSMTGIETSPREPLPEGL